MNTPTSRVHSNVDPGSLEEKTNVASVAVVVASGFALIVVSGAAVSGGGEIVHHWLAGVGSTLPSPSTARTAKVCVATARPEYSAGVSHATNAAPSREHS